MEQFNVVVEGSDKQFNFECYENTHPIEIGDYFLFHTLGVWAVGKCDSETEKYEINPNDRVRDPNMVIDLVTGFWHN